VQDLLGATLPQFGFRPIFAAVKPDQFGKRRHHREAPLYETPMRGRFDLRPAKALADIIRRERCQIIHTHTVRAALVGRAAAALTGVPMVHHIHSPTTAETTRSWRNWINAGIERISTRKIAAAITVSESLAQYAVKHGIPAERIAVVHNGVPVFHDYAERETPRGTWNIGCMALYRPRKGLETLLDAMAQMLQAGLKVKLRAVGKFETPDYEREIHERVAKLGIAEHVEWRGFRSDTPAEFAAMDLFVLPSLFGEGMPMVVLEAMSFGVPVIASRVEGIPEAIVDGRDGLIVPPGDAASLAEAAARFFCGELPWNVIRHRARARQVAHFSTESMAGRTADVYRRVLAEAGGDSLDLNVTEEIVRHEVAEPAAV
jgi:glycosyltransferase involved in cell wall biosynthesis